MNTRRVCAKTAIKDLFAQLELENHTNIFLSWLARESRRLAGLSDPEPALHKCQFNFNGTRLESQLENGSGSGRMGLTVTPKKGASFMLDLVFDANEDEFWWVNKLKVEAQKYKFLPEQVLGLCQKHNLTVEDHEEIELFIPDLTTVPARY